VIPVLEQIVDEVRVDPVAESGSPEPLVKDVEDIREIGE
jgi:Txe/YoeB family toxin of Txe-Axe toxin-antitoxin module